MNGEELRSGHRHCADDAGADCLTRAIREKLGDLALASMNVAEISDGLRESCSWLVRLMNRHPEFEDAARLLHTKATQLGDLHEELSRRLTTLSTLIEDGAIEDAVKST